MKRRIDAGAVIACMLIGCSSPKTAASTDLGTDGGDAATQQGLPDAATPGDEPTDHSRCFSVPLPRAVGSCSVIDDFTTATLGPINASHVVLLPASDGRNGKFTHQDTDGTATGVVQDYSIVAVSGAELPAGIDRGVHFAETGFTNWGADYSLSFTGGCYDISGTAYDGIAFYAKATGDLPLLFGVHTSKTTAEFDCGGTDVCWGFFRSAIRLSATWTEYRIKFSDLAQPSWAIPQVPFDPTKLVALIWATAAGGDADWTVTDIRFTGSDDTSGCATQ
jgi:hypothetical protein